MAAETGLHRGVWVYPGLWIPNWGLIQMYEYAQVFGSPIGATHRCSESQPRLHTGVWIPNRGYEKVVWSPKQAIVQVATEIAAASS